MIRSLRYIKSIPGILSLAFLPFSTLPGWVNAQTNSQIVAMTKAATFDDVREVKALIDKGMSPNQQTPKGMPILMLAMQEKSMKTVDYLINVKGIDLNQANISNETPLMFASLYGMLPEVKILVNQKEVPVNRSGWTPLHYACTNGHLNIAEFLLDKGAAVDAPSPNGTTPIMMAIRAGNIQLVRLLLDRGADIRIRNQQDYSAIDVAELFNQDEIQKGLRARWQKLYNSPYPGGPKS
jgi:ankyrin repeat protein